MLVGAAKTNNETLVQCPVGIPRRASGLRYFPGKPPRPAMMERMDVLDDPSRRGGERELASLPIALDLAALSRRAFLGGSLIALGCAGHPGAAGLAPAAGVNPYRLPTTVVPRRYELRVAPDLGAGRFRGEETVEVTVREPVREVILNAVKLEIGDAVIWDGQGRTLPATVVPEEAAERVRLRFAQVLEPGVWRLRIAFAGALSQRLQGFYLSRVKGADGRET